MRIELHHDDGTVADITDQVQRIYDLLTASRDYGSGFLDWEDVSAITLLARTAGWQMPHYPKRFCADCKHLHSNHHIGRISLEGREVLSEQCWYRIYPPDGGGFHLCGCPTFKDMLDDEDNL